MNTPSLPEFNPDPSSAVLRSGVAEEWTKRERARVLLVDDDESVLRTLKAILEEGQFDVTTVVCGEAALQLVKRETFTLVITGVRMPSMGGIEVLRRVREIDTELPVVIMTGSPDIEMAMEALRYNVFDFLITPLRLPIVLHIATKAVESFEYARMRAEYDRMLENSVREKTEELRIALGRLKAANVEVIYRLTRAAEYKDDDTAAHIKRIAHYAELLSRQLGLSAEFIEAIVYASPMHDVGKIGIPDGILFKPGPLSPGEFEIAKQHVRIGAEILCGSDYFGLQMAERIALSHHERWDGTGYPNGLRGEDIPLEARIVMIVDQYDALRNKRPYKDPLPHSEACRILLEGDHRTRPEHFDPDVLEAFRRVHDEFNEVFAALQQQDNGLYCDWRVARR